MKHWLLSTAFLAATFSSHAQVGIGVTTPKAFFNVAPGKTVLFGGDTLGEGSKLLWSPSKAAFRAGSTVSNYWDNSNLGQNSFAVGNSTLASGEASVAMGLSSNAQGNASVAMGAGANASGNQSFAVNGIATEAGSIALGIASQATSENTLALGTSSKATGIGSMAIGNSEANGNYAVAIGLQNRANGNFSTAIGKNAYALGYGSCVISDASASYANEFAAGQVSNQMTMRFTNGYRLFTTKDQTAGVTLSNGSGSWNSVSDRSKKENFKPLDAEAILTKVARMPVTEWNYKSQPSTQKHIGVVAQDFYAAFQLDGIGNDTTINTVDIDGVNMISIQALEKRTQDLKAENQQLKAKLAAYEARMERMEALLTNKSEQASVKEPISHSGK